jgi:hypothetical protein
MNLASVVNIFFANEANDLFIVRNAVGNSGRKQVRNNLKKFAQILCVKLIQVLCSHSNVLNSGVGKRR